MNIVVCEDTKLDKINLCHFIEQFFCGISCPVHITAYENGEAFLKDYKVGEVQIAFLDIYMPGISGIDVAKQIRKLHDDMIIILTSASMDHGFEGYQVDALGYILKPIKYEELEKVLIKCQKTFADAMRFIEVKSGRLTMRILHKNIIFIEIFSNTCLFHTVTEVIKSYRSLDEIEEQLNNQMFLRCHRSYIVNMNYICKVGEFDFSLTTGEKIPIRRLAKLQIKQAYYDYLFLFTRRTNL